MTKGFLYSTVIGGVIPSDEEFDRLEELFGWDDTDGRIHDMIHDKELVELLWVLYRNTVRMALVAELWEVSKNNFPDERSQFLLLN